MTTFREIEDELDELKQQVDELHAKLENERAERIKLDKLVFYCAFLGIVTLLFRILVHTTLGF